ncbi:efflux RND transporter permease subunit [Aliiglaciecola sp. CAU 1673]|uniref:efflux RND transporter permease subunit n=1 Tax=Aliiglaciecola sp. CAU 1673 TaxID=3032595 RepID=UPI0023D9F899|nr:efflux RND transporter permease subunit [Aliiglaciecola sp. CAU 1673]MDF2177374.1 efflux RND transporter permease subunit [Aliiglaciecola sp. CAU 1673]
MNKLAHKFFVNRIISSLALMIMLLGGLMAYQSMLRENYPDLAIPQALVSVEWPGAAAEQIEKEVTKPLEDALNGLNGLKKLQSGSQYSYSLVAVEFEADLDVSEAMARLRAKVDEGKADFPDGVKVPKVEQISVNDTPVLELMLYGPLDDYALSQVTRKIEKRLQSHPGIKKVELGGYRETAVQVRLLPERLKSLGVSPSQVRQRLQEANMDMSWGEYDDGDAVVQLYLAGRFDSIESLRKLPIVRRDDNRVIRLEELAMVYKGLEQALSRTAFSETGSAFESGVSLGIKKRPGVDTIGLIQETKALMAQMQQETFWPQNLKVAVISDESELIQESFDNIFDNIWQAMVAVFLILMVMLTWREALVAGLAIPLTFLATLMVLGLNGYSLNSMIIIGMVMALGLLVDVFILVMEGMHDHLYVKKQAFSEAAINTVKTYALPAMSGQLTTILAMAPMAAIGGIDGKFIRLIPVTVVTCLLFSYVIAFFVCIPLSKWLLADTKAKGETAVDKLTKTLEHKVRTWLLQNALQSKAQARNWVLLALGLFGISLVLFSQLPSLLYPKADGRNLAITIELAPNANLEQSQQVATLAGEYLSQQPFFDNVAMYVGKRSPRAIGSLSENLMLNDSPNFVGFSALFSPKDERPKLAYEYVDELRAGLEQALYEVPGISILFKPEVGGSTGEDPLQIVIMGDDMQRLADIALKVEQRLGTITGVSDARNNLGAWKTQVRLQANPEALSFHGISEQDFAAQLRLATEADEYGKFKLEGTEDDLKIRLSTYWQSRGDAMGGPRSISEIALINIFDSQGNVVPFANLVDYEIRSTAPVFTHTGTKRAITVMAKVEGITVGEVLDIMTPELDAMAGDWPQGYGYRFAGEAESAEDTYSQAGMVFVLAIFLVFAVLTLALNSLLQPIVVLLTLPLALTGTFSGFWLFGIPFSFPAMIGLISLVGIVVNDAIVMVDTMNNHLKAGKPYAQAIASGAADRLRPIFSTSLTTIVGLTPLALSDAMWFPLCMAIIFGLIAATVVAIVIIPSMYYLVSSRRANAIEAGLSSTTSPETA